MNNRQNKGFTLLEVIIALGVLGLGLVSILQAMPIAIRASVRAEYNSRAPLMAQQILETYKTNTRKLRFSQVLSEPIPVPRLFDAVDNDQDGLYDEEVMNGIDDDGDGEIDEDLPEYNWFPYFPVPLPKPNDDMSWQVLCSHVSVDGRVLPGVARVVVRIAWYPLEEPTTDDDPINGIDDDLDGEVDESIAFDFKYDLEGIIPLKPKEDEES